MKRNARALFVFGYVVVGVHASTSAETGAVGALLISLSDERPAAIPPETMYAWHEQRGTCYESMWAGEWERSFTNLPAGPYLLYASHVKRWYPNVPYRFGAEPVCVGAGITTTQAWTTRSAVIRIVAADAAVPQVVSSAVVRLQSKTGYTMRTGYISSGRCTLERVPPGEYVMSVEPQGMDATNFVFTWHPGVSARNGAETLGLHDNEELIVTVAICRAEEWVRGAVRWNGTPVPGAEVTWAGDHGATYRALTESNGTYHLALLCGSYLVRASQRGWLPEYYPGVHEATGAVPVAVTNRHSVTMDFDMDRGVTISGLATNFGHIDRVMVFAFEAHRPEVIDEIRYMPRAHARTNFPSSDCSTDGSYIIGGLTAGQYRICAEEYDSRGILPVNWGYNVAARAWEDACILTAEHASVVFTNILVGRGVRPAPLGYVTSVVWDAALQAPLPGALASTAYDWRATGADGVCVLPWRSPNVTEVLIAETGFMHLRTNLWALHAQTVQLARATMIACRVDAPGESLRASTMAALRTGTLIAAASAMCGESNRFTIYVPHGTPLYLFLNVPDGLWLHENSFFDAGLSTAQACAVEVAEGQWTNITFRLHPRSAPVLTTLYHCAGDDVTVACHDIPVTYTMDDQHSLTQQYTWMEWNMPPGGRYEQASGQFQWHSDGREQLVVVGRLPALPDTTRYGLVGGAGMGINLVPIPESCPVPVCSYAIVWLIGRKRTYLAMLRQRQRRYHDGHTDRAGTARGGQLDRGRPGQCSDCTHRQ